MSPATGAGRLLRGSGARQAQAVAGLSTARPAPVRTLARGHRYLAAGWCSTPRSTAAGSPTPSPGWAARSFLQRSGEIYELAAAQAFDGGRAHRLFAMRAAGAPRVRVRGTCPACALVCASAGRRCSAHPFRSPRVGELRLARAPSPVPLSAPPRAESCWGRSLGAGGAHRTLKFVGRSYYGLRVELVRQAPVHRIHYAGPPVTGRDRAVRSPATACSSVRSRLSQNALQRRSVSPRLTLLQIPRWPTAPRTSPCPMRSVLSSRTTGTTTT